MYINNEAITSFQDSSQAFYPTGEGNPPDGGCGMVGRYPAMAFTLAGGAMKATYGITLCPSYFTTPTTSSLGSPAANGGTAEIDRFKETGGMIALHEFVHLVTLNGKEPRSVPSEGTLY